MMDILNWSTQHPLAAILCGLFFISFAGAIGAVAGQMRVKR